MERRPMLRMDISTLRLPELRSLLASARVRGHDALVRQIEAEIAGRGRGAAPEATPAVAAPDEVLPMEVEARTPDDEPGLWLAEPQQGFGDHEAPPGTFESRAPDLALELPAPHPRRPRRWPLGFAVAGALAASGAVAWGLGGAPGLPDRQPAVVAPARAAAAPPPRAMTLRAEAEALPQAPSAPSPAPEPERQPQPRVIAEAERSAARPTRLDPCARPPSPAERLLCSDLSLSLLDHEMREAYGRAMEAGADPMALRESQSAWRRARDPVGDPRVLAELYDLRIRELEAAAEAPP